MTFTFTNAPKLTAGDMGVPDYGEALRKGFQTSADVYKPSTAASNLLAKMLENKINQPKAEGAQLSFDTDIGYKQALTNAANRKPMGSEIAQLFAMRNNLPEGSPDRATIDAILTQKAQPKNGFQLSVDPETGALTSVSVGGTGGRSGGGSVQSIDENGNPIILSPATPASKTAQQTQGSATAARQAVEKEATMPYVGFGGTVGMGQDYYNYLKGDKAAGERLAQAAAMASFAPDLAQNQLKAQGANPTIPAIQHQLQAIKQGWANGTDKIINNLPPELQARAKEIHAGWMDKIGAAKQVHAARGFPVSVPNRQENKTTTKEKPVPEGKIRVYFPDGPHVIPRGLLAEAQRSGATLKKEL